MNFDKYIPLVQQAIDTFWEPDCLQKSKNQSSQFENAGNRGAVTAGKQLDGFIQLMSQIAIDLGIPQDCIYTRGNHLPGYFRPTKDWDFIILSPSNKLVVVTEFKSQVGSFGNNFNNRTEEALGSAVDFWTAFRENAYPNQLAPWVGYLMIAEKSPQSTKPIRLHEPYFPVFEEFQNTSYLERYQILCRKLMLERHYTSASIIWTNAKKEFGSFATELSIEVFLKSYMGYLLGKIDEFGG